MICGKDFEAKRADAKTCSPVCRQKAKRAGIRFRGPNAVISPLTPEAAKEVKKIKIKNLKKVHLPDKEVKKLAESSFYYMGVEIPKGLKGIDLTIWKAEIKEKK